MGGRIGGQLFFGQGSGVGKVVLPSRGAYVKLLMRKLVCLELWCKHLRRRLSAALKLANRFIADLNLDKASAAIKKALASQL